MSGGSAILLTLVLLLGNAFFVAAEFALVSARRTQIEPKAEAGSWVARQTLKAMENVSSVIGLNQLGITICSLLLGAVGEPAIAHLIEPLLHQAQVSSHWLHPISFTIALAMVVYLHVVLGEMIPKNLAIAGPDRVALILGPPVWVLVLVFRPVIIFVNAMARLVLRAFGVALRDEVSSTYTREEVAALVEESRGEGLIEADEYQRLANALGFTEKTVSSVLLPLSALATVDPEQPVAQIEELCAATGFSRFPVLADDALIGYVHIKDVLELDDSLRERPPASRWVRPLAEIADSALLHEAFEVLRHDGSHMGKVLAGDGSLVGLVTMEDVIEELVGEIRDAAHQEEEQRESTSPARDR